eukprot:ANDGO_04885.mRNA.1 hypothetical protein
MAEIGSDSDRPNVTASDSPPVVLRLRSVIWLHRVLFAGQFLYSLSSTLMTFVLPPFLLELYDGGTYAATVYGFATATASLVQYVFLPVWGMVSQSKGRRRAFLSSTWINSFSCICLIPLVNKSVIALLFVSMIFHGGSAGVTATSMASIIDVVHLSHRPAMVGILLVMNLAAPTLLGAAIAFVLIGRIPYIWIWVLIALLAVLSAVVFSVSFKETLDHGHRTAWSWHPLNPLVPIIDWMSTPFFNFAFIAYSLYAYAVGFAIYFAFFYAHYRFSLSYSAYIPVSLALGILIGIFFLLAAPMNRRFGGYVTYLTGVCLALLSSLGMAFSTSAVMVIVFLLIGTPASFTPPALVTLVGNHVAPVKQGPFQSYLTSLLLLAWFMCGVTMGPLLSATVEDPNPWIAATSVWVCCGVLSLSVLLFLIGGYVNKYQYGFSDAPVKQTPTEHIELPEVHSRSSQLKRQAPGGLAASDVELQNDANPGR